VKDLAKHRMHGERYDIPPATVAAIEAARKRRSKLVAVGTTTVRCLEASAAVHGARSPAKPRTDLFIIPGFGSAWSTTDHNFHLPRSTLLVLVSRSPESSPYAKPIGTPRAALSLLFLRRRDAG